MASSAVQPNSRSAPLFQDVMMPSSVLLMIASSDDATIAASSDCASTLFSSARLVVDSSVCRVSSACVGAPHRSPSTMIGTIASR